ncbi:C-type lectin domain family 2 member B-like [Lithobates pipiens]
MNRESSEYDNVAPESSSNIPTKCITQHVALTSSIRKHRAHGASSCGCLVPSLLMVLLVTCVTLQSVLIFLRVSGRERDVRREDTSNSSHPPETYQTTQGRCLRCPDLWITIHDKCYFFSEDKKIWSLSDRDCEKHGSRLAQVKEKTIQSLVNVTGKGFWVGLTQFNIQGGVWTGIWPDGSTETLPYHEGTGSCAKLGSHLTLWNCYEELNYVCERNVV